MKRSEFLALMEIIVRVETSNPRYGKIDHVAIAQAILTTLDKCNIAPSKYYSGNGWEAEND